VYISIQLLTNQRKSPARRASGSGIEPCMRVSVYLIEAWLSVVFN